MALMHNKYYYRSKYLFTDKHLVLNDWCGLRLEGCCPLKTTPAYADAVHPTNKLVGFPVTAYVFTATVHQDDPG